MRGVYRFEFPVFLRHHLGHKPLARIRPQPRPLDMFAVEGGMPLALHPIVRSVVGNLDEFLGHHIGADVHGARVSLSKFSVVSSPMGNGALVETHLLSNLAERPPLCDFLTDEAGVLRIAQFPSH